MNGKNIQVTHDGSELYQNPHFDVIYFEWSFVFKIENAIHDV